MVRADPFSNSERLIFNSQRFYSQRLRQHKSVASNMSHPSLLPNVQPHEIVEMAAANTSECNRMLVVTFHHI